MKWWFHSIVSNKFNLVALWWNSKYDQATLPPKSFSFNWHGVSDVSVSDPAAHIHPAYTRTILYIRARFLGFSICWGFLLGGGGGWRRVGPPIMLRWPSYSNFFGRRQLLDVYCALFWEHGCEEILWSAGVALWELIMGHRPPSHTHAAVPGCSPVSQIAKVGWRLVQLGLLRGILRIPSFIGSPFNSLRPRSQSSNPV